MKLYIKKYLLNGGLFVQGLNVLTHWGLVTLTGQWTASWWDLLIQEDEFKNVIYKIMAIFHVLSVAWVSLDYSI